VSKIPKLPLCFGDYYNCQEDSPACSHAQDCKEVTDEIEEEELEE
jgi:hypothetical protein